MSRKLRFSKMHGLGNDFMVLDLVTQELDLATAPIARWADRHTGVGFDQLLVIAPPSVPEADFEYLIYNADGSQAEQCGNGARCVARFVADRKLTRRRELVFQTVTGPIEAQLLDDGGVAVNMPVPRFDADAIPINANAPGPRYELETNEARFEITAVSMGNPHAVIFTEDVARAPVLTAGAELSTHAAFPEGANVGFCQVIDRAFVRLRVYERGVGETQACGTAACAAVVAGCQQDLLGKRVKVSLPGGKLRIDWPEASAPVRMAGPATFVYDGELAV